MNKTTLAKLIIAKPTVAKPTVARLVMMVVLLATAPWARSAGNTGYQTTPGYYDSQGQSLQSKAPGKAGGKKTAANEEKLLPPDEVFTIWAQDEAVIQQYLGDEALEDKVQVRKRIETTATTRKLKNVVQPIGFASGKAQIPQSRVAELKALLARMKNRHNVRLHFIAHTDNAPLSGKLKETYGDNFGLSKARAEYAAEFFQKALDLPPDAISYDGVGDTQPIADNRSAAGKARNRRVEVQVWYDELKENVVEEKVIVPADRLNRIKVCRQEVVCKISYKQGSAKRAVLKNLLPPLRMEENQSQIPPLFLQQVKEVLKSLKGKRNLVMNFVGHTDNLPLEGAQKRIYGDHDAYSKARARRVALVIKDMLNLADKAVASDGRGKHMPIAPNNTVKGRALNRRIEVEFWYDDPYETVSSEPQACPESQAAETVTLVYEPPTGPLQPIFIVNGKPQIPGGFVQRVGELLKEVAKTKANARIRFLGYIDNETIERRIAMVYKDDIGLSTARARRTLEIFQKQLNLPDEKLVHEGRGVVHTEDVVNTGFVQFKGSRVQVDIIYDELAQLNDDNGLRIERIHRESKTRNPYLLNLMRITVDGKPVHDPYKHTADMQRCTDVALEKAHVQFRFDNLEIKPRLNVTAWPPAIRYRDDANTPALENQVRFQGYANYRNFIHKAEVRLFKAGQSVKDKPLAVIELDDHYRGTWQANFKSFQAPREEIQYLIRVYDKAGRFDEAKAQVLWLVDRVTPDAGQQPVPEDKAGKDKAGNEKAGNEKAGNEKAEDKTNHKAAGIEPEPGKDHGQPGDAKPKAGLFADLLDPDLLKGKAAPSAGDAKPRSPTPGPQTGRAPNTAAKVSDKPATTERDTSQWQRELHAAYGENRLVMQNIPLNGGTVRINGSHVPGTHTVWLAGRPVPIDDSGRFISEEIFPHGMHTVEVAVLDAGGNGYLYLRDLNMDKQGWFTVGIADITAVKDATNGPAALLANAQGNATSHYDNDLNIDGRLSFFTKGRFGKDWKLTASADTREGPLDGIFSNFMNKSPDHLFRRLDPDYAYPTLGDDGTVEEGAPTLGKFYFKLQKRQNFGMWGNFKAGYHSNELAAIDRALYGANSHYETKAATRYGEKRFMLDGFAAEPGTVAGRDEFRGTGGSLYYLRHQNILTGSERVRIEIRDKDSGLVIGVKNLSPALDFDIDPIQGRIILHDTLQSSAEDGFLVQDGSAAGHPVFLVVRYEYTPGFDDIGDISVGGNLQYWATDFLKFGLTGNRHDEAGNRHTLNGADITLRKSPNTWIKLETAATEGAGLDSLNSNDGGFSHEQLSRGLNVKAAAARLQAKTQLVDLFSGAPNWIKGSADVYVQERQAGFSATGQAANTAVKQAGAGLQLPVTPWINLKAKADKKAQEQGLHTTAMEVNTSFALLNWQLSGGVRHDQREDRSPVVPATQTQGRRTDVNVQLDYNSQKRWNLYGFAQGTAQTTGNRENNNRVGAGGGYRLGSRFKVNAEVSQGDLGPGAKVGSEYLVSDRSNLYLSYGLEDERGDTGIRARKGNLTGGFRSRYTDSASVYVEERYTHGDVPTGLSHAFGIDLAPSDLWNVGATMEAGTLQDHNTGAKTEREAYGLKLGLGRDLFKYGGALEYRIDSSDTGTPAATVTRTTWLLKNNLKLQLTPAWRLIGKLNMSESKSSQGEFYDGNFTDAVIGWGLRPVKRDWLNALFKYTYFYNLPATGQVTLNNSAAEYIQKSHILSMDAMLDLTKRWTLGAKYAHRLGQLSRDRTNPQFFDSNADLYILRADWHFVHKWDLLLEGRVLDLPEAQDRRSGVLLGIYRHVGKHLKFGVGYNFTDFSDDLTDMDFDSDGVFVNLVGKI